VAAAFLVVVIALAAIPQAPADGMSSHASAPGTPDEQLDQSVERDATQDPTRTSDVVGAASSVIRTDGVESEPDDVLTVEGRQAGTVESGCATVTSTLSNGNPETTDGALRVKVDGLGAFGVANGPGRDALFNPPGRTGAAGTVFTSGLYLSSTNDFLIDCDDGAETTTISRSSSTLITRKTLGSIQLDLDQRLGAIADGSSTLTQIYTLTSRASTGASLTLARHVNGDLRFDESTDDRGAATAAGKLLFEFDSSDEPAGSTSVGIAGALGSKDAPDRWTIQPFNYRDDILKAHGIPAGDNGVVHNDKDGDRVIDTPFNVTMSQQWNVGLAPGDRVVFVTTTRFGPPPRNRAPKALDDSIKTTEDTSGSVNVLANDSDPDGDTISLVDATDGVHGSVTCVGAVCTYTPSAHFHGADSFAYTITDGRGANTAGTVSVTVSPVNDPPEAADDAYTTSEDSVLTLSAPGVLGNDTDAESSGVKAALVNGPASGALALNEDGSFTYTPVANFNGTDSFTYRANDGAAASETATATITVNPVDEPRQTLTVIKVGNARITSSPAGIDCGDVCSAEFELGTVVTLTATPDPGWAFSGWTGACAGSATCVVTVDAGKAVTASFALPPPTPGQNVNATPIAGDILVKPAGTAQFVPLSAPSLVPVGSQIDATRGRVQLTAARTGGLTDTGQFYEGAFEVGQQTPRAFAELRLLLGDFSVCSLPSFAAADANKRRVRRLWGSGKGKFRTRGRYSSATVRGTIWRTDDRCDGTLTQVQEGSVTVRDFGRKRDIVVRAGKSYLAEPLPRGLASAGCTIIGTSRRDVLRGTKRRDVICGLAGNDVISGLGGNDKILGGPGHDRLRGGRGNDVLEGGAGNDWMNGGPGADVVHGGRGVDFLVSGNRGDEVRGGPGTDRCRAAAVRACP
jgi:hypothetical protein